jgi:hypothetical protein
MPTPVRSISPRIRLRQAFDDSAKSLTDSFGLNDHVTTSGNVGHWLADILLVGVAHQILTLIADLMWLIRSFTVDSARQHYNWGEIQRLQVDWDHRYKEMAKGQLVRAHSSDSSIINRCTNEIRWLVSGPLGGCCYLIEMLLRGGLVMVLSARSVRLQEFVPISRLLHPAVRSLLIICMLSLYASGSMRAFVLLMCILGWFACMRSILGGIFAQLGERVEGGAVGVGVWRLGIAAFSYHLRCHSNIFLAPSADRPQ